MAEEVGEAARAAGETVVMGSPNVVRGGSHLGWASAAVLAEAGICGRAGERLPLPRAWPGRRSASPIAERSTWPAPGR